MGANKQEFTGYAAVLTQLLFMGDKASRVPQELCLSYLHEYWPNPQSSQLQPQSRVQNPAAAWNAVLGPTPVSAHDLVTIYRDFFHMGILHDWMPHLPIAHIMDKTVPLIFRYLEVNITGVNRRAYRVYAAAIARDGVAALWRPFLPRFFHLTLHHHPKLIPVASVSIAYVALYRHLPGHDPLFLYLVLALHDKLMVYLTNQRVPKPLLVLFYLSLQHCGLDALPHVLTAAETQLRAVTPAMRQVMLKLLHGMLIKDFDLVRKDAVVRWYLRVTQRDYAFPKPISPSARM